MARQLHWKKRLAAVLAGGFMVLNTAVVLAAPMELSLEDSIALALKNNPTVKMAYADKDKAAWTVDQAKSGKGPTLDYGFSAMHSEKTTSSSVAGNLYSNDLTLSLPLYTGGITEGKIDQAKLGLKQADLGVEQAKQQIKLNATTGYFDILQARNLVKVDQESVDSLDAHLKNVQAQYAVGTVAKSDVLRSEVELANAQQTLIKAQNSYDVAVSSLNNVMGIPLDTEIKIKEELQYAAYPISLPDSMQLALQQRPEAAQADAAIDIAKKGVQIAKGDKLPSVALKGTTGWNGDNLPGTDNNNWSVGVAASWNIFDAGSTKAKVKEADADVDKATQSAKQTKDSIQLEVRQAYLNMQEAEKRITTSKVAVAKAEEDFKIAQVRYSAGVGTNLDVMDAEVALTQAKTNYVQALYDFNTSKAKLDKAVGAPVR